MRNICWEEAETAFSPVLSIFFRNVTARTERKRNKFHRERGTRRAPRIRQAPSVGQGRRSSVVPVPCDVWPFAIGRLLEIAI